MAKEIYQRHTERTVWGALERLGFHPGYAEVMVTEAFATGEHWSVTDDLRTYVRLDLVDRDDLPLILTRRRASASERRRSHGVR